LQHEQYMCIAKSKTSISINGSTQIMKGMKMRIYE
jgi:hypothetical protein